MAGLVVLLILGFIIYLLASRRKKVFPIGNVKGIYVYPFEGGGPVRLEEAEVTAKGITSKGIGDSVLMVIDKNGNVVSTANRSPAPAPATLTAPGPARLTVPGPTPQVAMHLQPRAGFHALRAPRAPRDEYMLKIMHSDQTVNAINTCVQCPMVESASPADIGAQLSCGCTAPGAVQSAMTLSVSLLLSGPMRLTKSIDTVRTPHSPYDYQNFMHSEQTFNTISTYDQYPGVESDNSSDKSAQLSCKCTVLGAVASAPDLMSDAMFFTKSVHALQTLRAPYCEQNITYLDETLNTTSTCIQCPVIESDNSANTMFQLSYECAAPGVIESTPENIRCGAMRIIKRTHELRAAHDNQNIMHSDQVFNTTSACLQCPMVERHSLANTNAQLSSGCTAPGAVESAMSLSVGLLMSGAMQLTKSSVSFGKLLLPSIYAVKSTNRKSTNQKSTSQKSTNQKSTNQKSTNQKSTNQKSTNQKSPKSKITPTSSQIKNPQKPKSEAAPNRGCQCKDRRRTDGISAAIRFTKSAVSFGKRLLSSINAAKFTTELSDTSTGCLTHGNKLKGKKKAEETPKRPVQSVLAELRTLMSGTDDKVSQLVSLTHPASAAPVHVDLKKVSTQGGKVIVCASDKTVTARDCGDEAALWIEKLLQPDGGDEKYRLVYADPKTRPNTTPVVVATSASVKAAGGRPNIVVGGGKVFEEKMWSMLKMNKMTLAPMGSDGPSSSFHGPAASPGRQPTAPVAGARMQLLSPATGGRIKVSDAVSHVGPIAGHHENKKD